MAFKKLVCGNLQLTSVFVSQFTINYIKYIYGNVH